MDCAGADDARDGCGHDDATTTGTAAAKRTFSLWVLGRTGASRIMPRVSGWRDNLAGQAMRLSAVAGWLGRKAPPWLLAWAALLAIALVVGPWGDYPLNDDWQYARAAHLLAKTGQLTIDTAIAPTLVAQLFIAWPFIEVLGTSHLVLRLLTMTMAAIVLWTLDQILSYAKVSRATRCKALLLVVLHPWSVSLALGFMTECYGYALALLGVVVWLRSRVACDGRYAQPAVTLGASLTAGLLVGASFWVRQFCVLVFPAMVGATLFHLASTRAWRRLPASLARMAAGAAVLALTVALYFVWAKDRGLLKGAFSGPLGQLSQVNLVDHQVVFGLQLFYLGAALLPLLATWPWRPQRGRTFLACAMALGFGLGAYGLIQLATSSDAGPLNLHRRFPFASNIIHTEGVGPNTLTDMFFGSRDHYAVLSRTFWQVVTAGVVALTALWGLPIRAADRLGRAARASREAFAFAATFAVLSMVMVTQASGQNGFDRYYWPVLLGAAVCVAILFDGEERAVRTPHGRALATVGFVALALPLAFFTVGGMHDYFRWNDARWHLVDHAKRLGVPSTSIDAGYEANGALSFETMRKHPESIDLDACIGRCHCEIPWGLAGIWTCFDDSYRIGMTVRDGYEELAREEPAAWLGKSRPVILSRRPSR